MHTRLRPARPELGLRPQPLKPLGDVTQGPLRQTSCPFALTYLYISLPQL